MTKPVITVIGSINMDLVTIASRFPAQGETILGEEFHLIPGGKGANQAVAAARLGAEVHMIGAVGADAFGNELVRALEREGVNIDNIKKFPIMGRGLRPLPFPNRITALLSFLGRTTRFFQKISTAASRSLPTAMPVCSSWKFQCL
jgi:hypothetical protein